MTRSYRQGSGELRHHQLFHLQLIAERETGHRPLGAAELRAGRRPRVDAPSATDDLIPPAMGVPVDDHVVAGRPARPPLVEVVDHPDAPSPDRPFDRRRIAGIIRRIPIHYHDAAQAAKSREDLLIAPVTRVPDLINAVKFPGDVRQQRRYVELALRVSNETDLHRNRSVAGSRRRSRTRPLPETDAPRISATGTRSNFPMTSSAAAASSSTTPSSVPCSS